MTDPKANAAHAAWRRDRADHDAYQRGLRQGFTSGWRSADEQIGPLAYSAGFDNGWREHRKKAAKSKRRAVAAARATPTLCTARLTSKDWPTRPRPSAGCARAWPTANQNQKEN